MLGDDEQELTTQGFGKVMQISVPPNAADNLSNTQNSFMSQKQQGIMFDKKVVITLPDQYKLKVDEIYENGL